MEARINLITNWINENGRYTIGEIKNIGVVPYEIPESRGSVVKVDGKIYNIYSVNPDFGGDKVVSETINVYDPAMEDKVRK